VLPVGGNERTRAQPDAPTRSRTGLAQIAIGPGARSAQADAPGRLRRSCCGHRRAGSKSPRHRADRLLPLGPAGRPSRGGRPPMRVLARRERPHSGVPSSPGRGRSRMAYSRGSPTCLTTVPRLARQRGLLDAAPRPRRRSKTVSTGKDTGSEIPLHLVRPQPGLAGRVPGRRHPCGLVKLCLRRRLARASPRPCAAASCTPPPG